MSGPFAIAAVSAVLRRLVSRGLGDVDLSIFGGSASAVTAHPPDQIVVGANEPAQLNLFMYRVIESAALRNDGLASRSPDGERVTNPALALDLHYLLTAYGAPELFPEALLGYGLQVLHEVPFLTRQYIRNTWPGGGNDPIEQALATSGLADQIEYIKLIPQNLSTEELSRLWTAFQAKYRPSASFVASVLLIQTTRGARAALPVLQQGQTGGGPSAQGSLIPPYPEIDTLNLPANQTAVRLGEEVQIVGHDFVDRAGDKNAVQVTVHLRLARFDIVRDIIVPATSRSDNEVRFLLPNEPANLPAGLYSLSVSVVPLAAPTAARASHAVGLVVAPRITTTLPASVNIGVLTLGVAPEIRAGQEVVLGLGDQQLAAAPITSNTSTVAFDSSALAPSTYRVRLRVDGFESLLVDRSDPRNPAFDPTQQITLH